MRLLSLSNMHMQFSEVYLPYIPVDFLYINVWHRFDDCNPYKYKTISLINLIDDYHFQRN